VKAGAASGLGQAIWMEGGPGWASGRYATLSDRLCRLDWIWFSWAE